MHCLLIHCTFLDIHPTKLRRLAIGDYEYAYYEVNCACVVSKYVHTHTYIDIHMHIYLTGYTKIDLIITYVQ